MQTEDLLLYDVRVVNPNIEKRQIFQKITSQLPQAYKNENEFFYFYDKMEVKEYPENYFNGNLKGCDFNNLKIFEFSKFIDLLKKEFINKTETEILSLKKELMNKAINGSLIFPILLHTPKNYFYLISGNIEMVIYKILGIFPIVRQLETNNAI